MNLERFVKAQERSYETALNEIRNGRKRSHWMWYIFPQIKGLGHSSTAQYYAIQNRVEAEQYLNHPILSKRLIEISEALLQVESNDASRILGYPDDMKLRSSMTLFAQVNDNPIFREVLNKFFDGKPDRRRTMYLTEKFIAEENIRSWSH